ncbi:FkbM family methyltransferase [Candidatus Woesebacteria bacterium]|nr:FkbM family methyltransferase [Candidatus Woesebacteria bacterium]
MFKEIFTKGNRLIERPDRLRVSAVNKLTQFTGRPFETSVKLSCGSVMRVKLPENVSTVLAYEGDYEPEISRMIEGSITPEDNFFDIGAHYGLRTLQANQILQGNGNIVAFEPSPEALRMLHTNCDMLPNVTIVDSAVSSSSGNTLNLTVLPTKFEASNTLGQVPRLPAEILAKIKTHSLPVKTISIDDFVSESGIVPNLIKIDAENHEMPILEGSHATLSICLPSVIMETGDCGRTPENSTQACLDLLGNLGYGFHSWNGNGLKPLSETSHSDQGNVLAIHKTKYLRQL